MEVTLEVQVAKQGKGKVAWQTSTSHPSLKRRLRPEIIELKALGSHCIFSGSFLNLFFLIFCEYKLCPQIEFSTLQVVAGG